MDLLFSPSLQFENETLSYEVKFSDEKYHFQKKGGGSYPHFSLFREHDEWLTNEALPPDLFKQATAALDNYLLQQH